MKRSNRTPFHRVFNRRDPDKAKRSGLIFVVGVIFLAVVLYLQS